jgi:hypothetical protein|tara:strand:- start:987 stop:1511 length:525 start_codon:yes stop_codon:yes gene_type:complete
MEIKKLSWLHRHQYDSLPNEYKELKKEFNTLNTSLSKKVKRKSKIEDELVELKYDIKELSITHNNLFKKLEFINKTYTPQMYLTSYTKVEGGGEYCQMIIKYLSTTKSIYLGTPIKIIKTFHTHIDNLNDKNYQYKVSEFLKPIITQHFIKLNDPKLFLRNTFRLKDIIEILDN